ncbi:MAG: TolC family protein [Planctomycetota bacterium]|nr:TolC family protein [Planctomycetota bacterium]MDA1213726.1 TolC family protein [Planctomycetota bacterium]
MGHFQPFRSCAMLGLLAMSLATGCTAVAGKLAGPAQDIPARDSHETLHASLKVASDSEDVSTTRRETSRIETVAYRDDQDGSSSPLTNLVSANGEVEEGTAELSATVPSMDSLPIDLPTVLKLAGANNLQIAFAAERVQQTLAQSDAADVLWIPSLRAGLNYNNHSGQIQDTRGDVINVNRNSFFVGGGAGFGNAPLNGATGGPARMFVDLSLVDVLFEPLAARQVVEAAEATREATFNDTLLQAVSAYVELVRSHLLERVAEEAVKNADELKKLTEEFARTGQGLQADAERARAEFESRRRSLLEANERASVASAELARLLRLEQGIELVPADTAPLPLVLFDEAVDLPDLIEQARANRPEIQTMHASVREMRHRVRQEQLRPWIPHLYAGASGGGFGGASGSSVDNFGGRADFDVAAVWEWENLGFGNEARRREQESRHQQAHIAANQWEDLVAAEVTQAYQRIRFRRQQIDVTKSQIYSATTALDLNMQGIRGGVIRPIEIQQAIDALASAHEQYLNAVLNHNLAQFELVRSVGQPPQSLQETPSSVENRTEESIQPN